jgi:biotin operon repressor
MEIEKQLLDRIPRTHSKAVHLAALSSELAISESQVKAIVKILRLQGIPVLSDSKGYWIAESEEERNEFTEQMKKQALSRLKIASEVRKQNIAGAEFKLLENKTKGRGN